MQLDGLVLDCADAEQTRKAAVAARRTDKDIDFDSVLVQLLADTGPVLQFARSRRVLRPNSDAAMRRLARGDLRLPAAERKALKYLLEKMQQAGFELP
jgi:hypothetical protein